MTKISLAWKHVLHRKVKNIFFWRSGNRKLDYRLAMVHFMTIYANHRNNVERKSLAFPPFLQDKLHQPITDS